MKTIKNADQLRSILRKYDIPVKVRPLDDGNIVSMGNDEYRANIGIDYPKNTVFKVAGSKKLRQAVLVFSEEATVEYEIVRLYCRYKKDCEKLQKSKVLRKIVDKERMLIPDSTFKIESSEVTTLSPKRWDSPHYPQTKYKEPPKLLGGRLDVTILVDIPERHNCFLIGVDETHTFIAQLLAPVESVKQAHLALRPNVSKKAVRVGEWFFDPLSDTEIEEMVRNSEKCDVNYWETWTCQEQSIDPRCIPRNTPQDITSDNHVAQVLIYVDEDVYVQGMIRDDFERHADRILTRWHRVVRNLELVNQSEHWD